MAVENLDKNGTLSNEADRGTEEKKGQDPEKSKEVVALSVQDAAAKARQPLKLKLQEHSSLPGNRPVEASHLKVVGKFSSVGADRPIVAGDFKISSSMTVSGNRPIAVSTLKISETYTVMGNRPVASNQIDDPTTLMGYID